MATLGIWVFFLLALVLGVAMMTAVSFGFAAVWVLLEPEPCNWRQRRRVIAARGKLLAVGTSAAIVLMVFGYLIVGGR